uniref:small monomeric GTPase n=1 Tax=Hucho hucho TaxID=62062 RepID=A0A4W5QYK2_9TELE
MVVRVKPSSHHCSKTIEGTQQKVEANILLLGAENVAKSALTVRFIIRRFIGEYGGIESIYTITESIIEKQLKWADGVILVYSICDSSSFEVVRQQVQRIRHASRKMSATVPFIIVETNAICSTDGQSQVRRADSLLSRKTAYFSRYVFHGLIDLIKESRAQRKGAAGITSIVRSMSALFGKKRAEYSTTG